MTEQRYAKTQDEVAGLMGISRRHFGNIAKEPGAPHKRSKGYYVPEWREFHNNLKKSKLKGDGSLRDEKLLREIKRLDIQIQKDLENVVVKSEEEARFRAKVKTIKKAVIDWEQHEKAKQPELVEMIEKLSKSLLELCHNYIAEEAND